MRFLIASTNPGKIREFRQMLGEAGVAITLLAPTGTVRVRGEYWDASAPPGAHLEPGSKVRITAIQGLKLSVKADSSGE